MPFRKWKKSIQLYFFFKRLKTKNREWLNNKTQIIFQCHVNKMSSESKIPKFYINKIIIV